MNFDLTDDQKAIRNAFARFCDERIAPQAAALDEAHAFPRELFSQLAALGFFGIRYPESAGGTGLDLVTYCLALTEVARGSLSLAGCAAMQSLMGTKFLHMLGNDDIIERLFKPALRGEKIGAICMTEPNAGSDLDALATSAKKVEGGYALSGQKTWVTNAPVADFFTVFARVGPAVQRVQQLGHGQPRQAGPGFLRRGGFRAHLPRLLKVGAEVTQIFWPLIR